MDASKNVAFIGTVGVPNRYGGFEAFLEHCAPEMAQRLNTVSVTCYSGAYEDLSPDFKGVRRLFLNVPANGALSVLHDLLAFFRVFLKSTHIVVLGVSGGAWFPLFRLLCSITGKKLLVNVDGVEWKRGKFSRSRRFLLRVFDSLAQFCSHVVIYDNAALAQYLLQSCREKSVLIPYSGDHVLRLQGVSRVPKTALTVCRIEPENNIHLMIEGALASSLNKYTIVGNWNASEYGRNLKEKYKNAKELDLLDPIYDQKILAQYRESCDVYIHGHSVGGTNPSLVEMLFYDCRILCFDVSYHRETGGSSLEYFSEASDLAKLINSSSSTVGERAQYRTKYSRQNISDLYIQALDH